MTKTFYKHILRGGLIIALSLSVSACSVKLLYNNFDRFARWSISDYVDLNKSQKAYFNSEIKRLMYWHRTSELAKYAAYLEQVRLQITQGALTEAELKDFVGQILIWGETLQTAMIPMAGQVLASLDAEQINQLPYRLEETNAEWVEDEVEATVRQAQIAWVERMEDNFKRLTGALNRQQLDYLKSVSDRYQPELVLWIEYRRRWQAELMTLLRNSQLHINANDTAGGVQFLAEFRLLAENTRGYYGVAYQTVYEENQALDIEVSAGLLSMLTPRQQRRLNRRLARLIADFNELVAEAEEQIPEPSACLVRTSSCPSNYNSMPSLRQ